MIMAKAKQKIVAKTTTTKTKSKKSNGSKRGNRKRCPTCGRFI